MRILLWLVDSTRAVRIYGLFLTAANDRCAIMRRYHCLQLRCDFFASILRNIISSRVKYVAGQDCVFGDIKEKRFLIIDYTSRFTRKIRAGEHGRAFACTNPTNGNKTSCGRKCIEQTSNKFTAE